MAVRLEDRQEHALDAGRMFVVMATVLMSVIVRVLVAVGMVIRMRMFVFVVRMTVIFLLHG